MCTQPCAVAADTRGMLEQVIDELDVVAASLQLRLLGLGIGSSATAEQLTALIVDRRARIDARDLAGERNPLAGLHLSHTEQCVVWFLMAASLRRDVRSMLSQILGETAADPTTEAIRTIVYGDRPSSAADRELSELGTLRRLGVLERTDTHADEVHESRRTWCIGASVRSLLLGHLEPAQTCHSTIDLVVDTATVAAVTRALAGERSIVTVLGTPGLGRRSLARHAAGIGGIWELDLRRIRGDVRCLQKQLRSLALECRLTGKTPLLCNLDALDAERLAIVATEFAPLIEGNILVTCGVQRPHVEWDRPVIVIEMGQPTHAQRARLWHEALGQGTAEDAERLANQYPLAPALIVRASAAAKARAGERAMEPEDIYAGIKAVLDDRLGAFAKRITITQTWDDIVLPPDQVDAIVELIARVRGRHTVYERWGFAAKVGKGLGVSALFSGPPGTGKTMVAGLIAKDLGLELYQVDLAKIVSKFIGETEKNLAALFDAAEACHAILLFDEADALFGKRTDVKSSNDRYANFETNYLLQRLETFTGICLLTSNHESHIDPAFQRRLSLHLRFEVPDADERAQLWRAVLPAGAPLGGEIDFVALARRYAMSGGYIKNAALRAAFLAADQAQPITGAHLDRAARVEYEGMGKIAA